MTSHVERDRVLIEGIRRGSESAFTELVSNYYAPLCQFVKSVTSSNDYVEEAVDDVFMSIWENRGESVPLDAIPQYLFAAARNNALMHIRSSMRREKREEAYVADLTISSPTATDQALFGESGSHSDRIDLLNKIVATLPPRCREIFVLRWTGHLSYTDIAKVMEISAKTVENQLVIAIRKIRDEAKNL